MPIAERQRAANFPRLKVCGVTRLEDVELLADAGIDAVGVNFVPISRRKVGLARARQLCARAAELSISRVAVVMDPTEDELSALLNNVDVDWVQFHGRERPDLYDVCGDRGVIKAISWTERSVEGDLARLWRARFESQADHRPPRPAGFLVDAYAPVDGGGTGRVAKWNLLFPRPSQLARWPLMLAGGLTADNVAEAIRIAVPDAVDTASGVESAPGIKSTAKVRAFASNARAAFAALAE